VCVEYRKLLAEYHGPGEDIDEADDDTVNGLALMHFATTGRDERVRNVSMSFLAALCSDHLAEFISIWQNMV
jgi:hypothetical protein